MCTLLLPLPLAYIVGFSIWTASVSHNCYYSPMLPPPPVHVAAVQLMQGLTTGAALHVHFPRLVGSPVFPARHRRYYVDQYLRIAMLADRGWIHPGFLRPTLERVQQIDPDHPALPGLMDVLERRSDPSQPAPLARGVGRADAVHAKTPNRTGKASFPPPTVVRDIVGTSTDVSARVMVV